jgi:hypothetical protein
MRLSLITFLLFAGISCSRSTSYSRGSVAAMPASDEILLGHLLRRVQDLHSELDKQENEVLKHDKRRLRNRSRHLKDTPSDPQCKTRWMPRGSATKA